MTEQACDGRAAGWPAWHVHLASDLAGVTLPWLLEDARHWIGIHSEATGLDHIGHLAQRRAAREQWEPILTESRARSMPEEAAKARRWVRAVARASRECQARPRPRPAPADYVRSLADAVVAAVRLRIAGESVPDAAGLVHATVSPLVVDPGPTERPDDPHIAIIDLRPEAIDRWAEANPAGPDDKADDDEPQLPSPLSPAGRQAVARQAVACLRATVSQIHRVLRLTTALDVDEAGDYAGHPGEPGGAYTPSLDARALPDNLLIGLVVEILRLQDAEARRWSAEPAARTVAAAEAPRKEVPPGD